MLKSKSDPLSTMRHSALMFSGGGLKLYPKTKLGIGPAIENGFYYDFEFEKPFQRGSSQNRERNGQNRQKQFSFY